jgi:cytidine deaminase
MLETSVLQQLMESALEARTRAYAPYSHYQVGAALLTVDHSIFSGCNIENASYGATLCAERNAIAQAVSKGYTSFLAIAIAGGMEGSPITDFAYPCGICRQVMAEFTTPDFPIYLVKSLQVYEQFTLEELLPYSFQLSHSSRGETK